VHDNHSTYNCYVDRCQADVARQIVGKTHICLLKPLCILPHGAPEQLETCKISLSRLIGSFGAFLMRFVILSDGSRSSWGRLRTRHHHGSLTPSLHESLSLVFALPDPSALGHRVDCVLNLAAHLIMIYQTAAIITLHLLSDMG
jgi:hypothetical protein